MKKTESETTLTGDKTAENLDVELWKIHSEWLLLMRQQDKVQKAYDLKIAEINKATEMLINPIIQRINELDAAEQEILRKQEDKINAHTRNNGESLSN